MGTEALILLILAVVFGLYMAWNIGANDVANAMGTSVGSGALTIKRAVILAAIMEFSGAFLVGPHVSETVRNGIVDPQLFADAPMMLCLGMLAALLAAGVWLQLASYFGWPVSTTHSIVGAIVGFGVVYGGFEAVKWGKVGYIAASWVVSPLLAGIISFAIFRMLLMTIFYKPNPIAAAKKGTPYITMVVMVTMMLVLTFKGLKPFWNNLGYEHLDPLPLVIGLTAALVAGLAGAFIARRLVRNVQDSDPVVEAHTQQLYQSRALAKAIMHLRRIRNTSVDQTKEEADDLLQRTEKMLIRLHSQEDVQTTQSAFHRVERIFIYLQVISAAFVALAHGANDVANAIGPLSVVVEIARSDMTKIPLETPVSLGVLALGGLGIVVGLATWGWRVIQTIGKRITELTPSRGFCAEFAAAITILLASVYKLPISTTHTLVGAVLGIGLARGLGAINLNTVRFIVISWVITIPAGAGLAVIFFKILEMIFA